MGVGSGILEPQPPNLIRGEEMSRFVPVFTGGVLGDNEFVIPLENFLFDSEEELLESNEGRSFIEFFPFPVKFSRVLDVSEGFEGALVTVGGEALYCISGEIYEGLE